MLEGVRKIAHLPSPSLSLRQIDDPDLAAPLEKISKS
jgi:hypothetical protein